MEYDKQPYENTDNLITIAEAVERKAYGKDVRSAIADGFRQFDVIKNNVNSLSETLNQINDKLTSLEEITNKNDSLSRLDKLEARLNRIILGTDTEAIHDVIFKMKKDGEI